MNDISFRKCFELFQRSDRVGSSLKTFAACLVSNLDEYSPKLSHHWKAKATRSLRFVFLLQPSKPRTGEIGSGSWLIPTATATPSARNATSHRKPAAKFNTGVTLTDRFAMLPTPRTMDGEIEESVTAWTARHDRKAKEGINLHKPLCVAIQMLPTPKARTGADCPSERQRHTPSLDSQIAMLPPPATRDYKGANSPEHLAKERGHHDQLPNAIAMIKTPSAFDATVSSPKANPTSGNSGSLAQEMECGYRTGGTNPGLRLQPAFVEWMMGFPMNYTSLEAETTGSAA